MNPLHLKATALHNILSSSRTHIDKVTQGIQQLEGLELSLWPHVLQKKFETQLIGFNQILLSYPINTFEDYRLISEPDLIHMFILLQNMALILMDAPAIA